MKNNQAITIEEGPAPVIRALFKILDAEHVNSFRSGKLRLGSVKSFREKYEGEGGRRNDRNEFLSHVFQPSLVNVTLGGIPIGGIAGPIQVRENLDHRSYVHCMTAVTDRHLNAGSGKYEPCDELMKIADSVVIVTEISEFTRRIRQAILRPGYFSACPGTGGKCTSLVEYVDLNRHHGELGPYRKSAEYSFQQEWRIALIDRRDGMEHYPEYVFLDVGDISDITVAASMRESGKFCIEVMAGD